MNKFSRIIIALSIVTFAGCASKPKLSDTEVSNRYPALKSFEEALAVSDSNEVDVLSANLYQKANALYTAAAASAKLGSETTDSTIQQGQKVLDQANQKADLARDTLANVISYRDRALRSGANNKDPKGFAEAEKKMMELGNLIAEGEIAEVREERQALAKSYSKLEVAALKSATAKEARIKINEAKKLKADDYAPQTYQLALSELDLASSVLDSDANAADKAAAHANKAYQLASQAIEITEVIKEFKQSGMTDEQIVLWYQKQLSTAFAPISNDLNFGQPNKNLIQGVSKDLAAIVERAEQNETALAQTKEKFAFEVAAQQEEKRLQKEFESRFKTVQSTFSAEEAEVYRQGNNVLIRSYGFSFPSGGSEIQSSNYPLLKKITQAIAQFPNAKVQVSGHTDNRGSDELNQTLSSERSENVAKFLVDMGNISDSRVSSLGYGKTRPLASNDTSEGRAANRRVEVLILND